MTPRPLIDPDALAAALADPDPGRRPTVLDVRWDLAQGPRSDLYAQAHIPGAVFIDLDRVLAGPAGDRRRGRHPLPEPALFVAGMRAAGVSDGRLVVVYDDSGATIAARGWWLLRHYGHSDVAVLDGGLTGWMSTGHPIDSVVAGSDTVAPRAGDFSGEPGNMPTLDADSAQALAGSAAGVLIDARAGERFRGEVEPMDPAAGHIPGARNRPTTDNLDDGRRFRDPEALAADFSALGVDPATAVGAYCGSGVTAAHEVLALELAGIPAALYPGSWSEWSANPVRPVATGAAD